MLLYLTFALTLLSGIAWTAARLTLSLYALKLGAQPFGVGILAAMFNIFPLLLSWPIGRLSDRFGPRWPLMVSALCGIIGLVIPFFFHELPALYVGAAMSGLSFALYLVNVQNLVGVLSQPDRRAQNFSTFSLMGSTSNFVGPLMSGFLVDHLGHAVACLWIVALPAASGVILATSGRRLPGGTRTEDATELRMLDTLTDRSIWPMLATSSLVKLGTDLYQFYMPIYGRSIGLSASAIGTVLAAFAVAAFVVRFVLPRLMSVLGDDKLLASAFYIAAASFVLLPLFKSAMLLAVVSFVFGLGMGCGQPITTIQLFSRSAEGRSGETLGLRLTVNNLMRVVGPTLFGFIASAVGLFPVFYINALMMGAGGALSRRRNSRE